MMHDVLDHATSEIASGSKLGLDATKKLPGEGFKRPWPPLIKMSDEIRRKIDSLTRRVYRHRPDWQRSGRKLPRQ
jgi:4-hydroxy-3-polyprenylbenzoate decarboxylase